MVDARWRVPLDTNIWISAFINPVGPPAHVLDLYTEGHYQLVVSQPLLDEISDVLSRPRVRRAVRFRDDWMTLWLRRLQREAVLVAPKGNLQLCRDPKDDIVLETAILGEADYLVSRDDDIKRDLNLIAHLREHNIAVVTVAQFLKLLGDN
ncbi:MAG TPA: putative toxin-antitoxin system toxin component, PIN family [Thermomicrobiales bacterium]|nr:putative toxin-antitoxin system toxin component, PIN family [Thermomicrobiales bacterium]